MQINSPTTAPDYKAGNLREGTLKSKTMLHGREGALNNYRLSWETAEESWSTPRHRHNYDQIRFPITGMVEYGADLPTLPIGVVAYFPESMRYGPQVRHDGSTTLTLQFGGASANGFLSPDQRKRGLDELLQRGRLENGYYTWTDAAGKKHNQDSYEAVWEYVRGRKMSYAKPRYGHHIVMEPACANWVEDPRQPGVGRKWLGSFTERQFSISFLRLDPGAKLKLDPYAAPQILFVAKGAVSQGGQTYGLHTAFGLEDNEGPAEFTGVEAAELLFIQLPVFAPGEQGAGTAAAYRVPDEALAE
ncbi:MAG TPA: hypothetical protein VH105_09340 [Burkholderiales bacterium]|jgi:transposase|nr:hypothetical protein [Burkholderiales bacterium]